MENRLEGKVAYYVNKMPEVGTPIELGHACGIVFAMVHGGAVAEGLLRVNEKGILVIDPTEINR